MRRLRPNHENVRSTNPATWQDDKAFQVVTALDDFEAQHRNFDNGGFDLPRVVAIVRPDQRITKISA